MTPSSNAGSCAMQITFLSLPGADDALVINVVFNFITSLAAITGNLLITFCIVRTPSLHSATNFLFLGLALSDVGVGLVIEPMYISHDQSLQGPSSRLRRHNYLLYRFNVSDSCFSVNNDSNQRRPIFGHSLSLAVSSVGDGEKIMYFQKTLWTICGLFTISRMAG